MRFVFKDTGSWANAYPTCNGNRQSPIDIQPRMTALKAYPKFKFVNYGYVDQMILTNNGHTGKFLTVLQAQTFDVYCAFV